MRKLAIFCVCFASAVFAANYLLPEGLLLPLGAAAAALCLPLYCVLKGRPKPRLRAILLAAGLAAGLLWTLAYTQIFYQPARALDAQTIRATASVSEWPQETDYGWSVLTRLETETVAVPTLFYLDEQGKNLRPGDVISTVARCTLAERTFSGEEITYYTAKGIFLRCEAYGELTFERPAHLSPRYLPALLSKTLKEGIDKAFPDDCAPLVRALVTGNRDSLSDPFTSSLQRTGLSHTVAVSGMHVAFLAGLLAFLLGVGRRRTALTLIPVILLFMTVAGSTPSVVRASVMVILLQIAPLFDRERDGPTALSFALLLILVQNPFAATHIGLQLSFAAVAGILLCSERVQLRLLGKLRLKKARPFSPRGLWNNAVYFVVSTFSATVGAMVLTTPLVALYFNSVSLISPLSNLLTLWAVGLTFVIGLLAGVAGAVIPALGTLAALLAVPLVRYLNWVVPSLARLPFASVGMDSFYYRAWLVFVYLLLVCAVLLKGRKRVWVPLCAGALTLCVAVLCSVFTLRGGDLSVTVLDVGQGQSVVLRMGDHLTLTDCGGDALDDAGDIAADCVQSMGASRVDLLVLTHCHADHANGVPQLLERLEVSELVLPETQTDSALRQKILALARECGTRVRFISQDETISLPDGQTLTVFAPLGAGDTNEEGLTVLADAGEFEALITGDMGGDVERTLLEHAALPDIELLVVGHHGSKYSTTDELLAAVRPELAIISVGADNRYGHPADGTLERLENFEAEVWRTDLRGTVRVNVD